MNLLVTGAWGIEHIEKLEKQGHIVCYLQFEKDELPCAYEWVEGVICNGLFLTHPIDKFTNLKYVQLTSAGFDRVPMDYVQSHGIAIRNARGVYSIPMAEFALSGVLQLYKQTAFFADKQRKHLWEKHRGLMELFGKTVCIVGCGSVGTECAKRFAAFGCQVIGVDLFPRADENYERMVSLEELDAELPRADVLVLTLPLTEQTRHMMNRERFARLKPGMVLVNIARGAVVETEALTEALPNMGGAVLDVFEEEPLNENSPLWDMENVIVTPHNSFVGEGNGKRLSDVIIENVRNAAK